MVQGEEAELLQKSNDSEKFVKKTAIHSDGKQKTHGTEQDFLAKDL